MSTQEQDPKDQSSTDQSTAPEPTPPEPTPPVKPPTKPAMPPEIGGPKGPEPTRYGDWEQKGRVSDF